MHKIIPLVINGWICFPSSAVMGGAGGGRFGALQGLWSRRVWGSRLGVVKNMVGE